MAAHNNRGSRMRHQKGYYPQSRGSHGARFDPTSADLPLYGSEMDKEPVTPGPDGQGPITGPYIGDDAIGAQHLAELSILAEHLADNAIAQRHLQDAAVGTEEIAALSVTTANLAAFAVTAGKILAGSITSDKIYAGGITANVITSGTLRVGGVDGADFVDVFDVDGDLMFRISQKGILAIDPDDPDLACRFRDGILEFTQDFTLGEDLCTWNTAISAEGIRADSIRVGIAPGGHNLIPNSSFEISPFATGSTKVWTSAGDWGTTIGTDVNVDKSTGDLKLTTATY